MRTLVATAALVLCAAMLPAQTDITVPAGYLNIPGDHSTFEIAHYWTQGTRTQNATQGIAKTEATFKELWYRTSKAWTYSTNSGMGRKWTAVSLVLGHTDASKMTSVFTANYLGVGTTVFSGAWSVPSHTTGTPKQIWGNAGVLPFSTNFVYNGVTDILEDWTLGKATVNNGYTGFYLDYRRDSCSSRSTRSSRLVYPGSGASMYVPKAPYGSGTRCSGFSASADAYALAQVILYGDTYPVTSARGKFKAFLHSYNTRPNAAVGNFLTLGGSDTGRNIGALCNHLHINLGFQLTFALATADSGGNWGDRNGTPLVTYNPIFVGWEIYWQAVWEDATTGGLALSIGTKLVMPRKPGNGCGLSTTVHRYYDGSSWYPSATNTGIGYLILLNKDYGPITRYSKS